MDRVAGSPISKALVYGFDWRGPRSDPYGLAADRERLRFADQAVQHLDSEGGVAQLSGSQACAQLEDDQVLVSAHRRFGMVAPSVAYRLLPANAAALCQKCDVTVTRARLVRISRAQYCVGPRWDNHLNR